MKKYLLLGIILSTAVIAMEEFSVSELQQLDKGEEVVLTSQEIAAAQREIIDELSVLPRSLEQLCIEELFKNPRYYIKQDVETKINQDVQEIINHCWLNYIKVRTKFSANARSLLLGPSSVLQEKISLNQLLLVEACVYIKEEELQLTEQENRIFSAFHPCIKKRIEPYIKKSLLLKLYELCCT